MRTLKHLALVTAEELVRWVERSMKTDGARMTAADARREVENFRLIYFNRGPMDDEYGGAPILGWPTRWRSDMRNWLIAAVPVFLPAAVLVGTVALLNGCF